MHTTATVARVVLDLPIPQDFDFLIPAQMAVVPGQLVVVPFGQREMIGMVRACCHDSEVPAGKLRALKAVVEELPPFDAKTLSVMNFCADYYHAPLGQVAAAAVPPVVRARAGSAHSAAPTRPMRLQITAAGATALDIVPNRASAQRALLVLLQSGDLPRAAVRAQLPQSANWVKPFIARGWLAEIPEEDGAADRSQPGKPSTASMVGALALTTDQATAVSALTAAADRYQAFLLEGITGSGKTEVYLHAIAATLGHGKQALVLVPEINLTPAFLRKIQSRFPHHHVVAAHSAMSSRARIDGWRAAADGRADIVIGTRLAVFTPMPRLGLIVVDEEHDTSYKQQEGVRYSARDVAVFRAHAMGCPVVLGSATPSIESLDNVARGRFMRLALPRRAVEAARLPEVGFIRLDAEKAPDGLTASLIRALAETIARGEQAMVFINRRGYAPALVCAACGWMPDCKQCSAHLVWHRSAGRMKCHHCGTTARKPETCPNCQSTDFHAAGQGTERIEDALRAALPDARIARVDRDSTRRQGSADKIFQAAEAGDVDILVGTQMLAKGHHFPKLTLVGVVNTDGAVFAADFRAAERMAQQLMQVSGRAGRDQLPGRVLIQTRFVTHPVYQAVALHRYDQFVDVALAERKIMHLPPYSYLALLRAESRDADALTRFMTAARECAAPATRADTTELRVWEPVPATLARKAGYTRMQLLVQSSQRNRLQHFLSHWLADVRALEAARTKVKWTIDVDPIEI